MLTPHCASWSDSSQHRGGVPQRASSTLNEETRTVLAIMSVKAQLFQQACRSSCLLSNAPPTLATSTSRLLKRSYAQSSLGGLNAPGANQHPQRKAITITSDDGRLHWSELSTREKA